jgi:hypothetical protein
MNLHENINRIQEMMGIIPENKNSPIPKMVDLIGVNDTILYIGGIDKFNTMGGMDYLFNKVDELLKNYTNLIITDTNVDTWETVAYGEGHDDYRIKPGYVYFDWSKSLKGKPTTHLSVDKELSDHLKSLDIPDNITKTLLERWVRKYYNDIPPIDEVMFGSNIGYGNDDEPDFPTNPKFNTPVIPREEPKTISKEEIIKLLKNTSEEYPKENYDDLLDWMWDIFTDVNVKISDKGFEVDLTNLKKEYDYVLRDIWGPSDYPTNDEMMSFSF